MRVFGPWGLRSIHVSWAVYVSQSLSWTQVQWRDKVATAQREAHAKEQK